MQVSVAWLNFLCSFDPIFVLPVPTVAPELPSTTSAPLAHTPGRRTGTGSAALSAPAARAASSRIALAGFRPAGLLAVLSSAGHAPPFAAAAAAGGSAGVSRSLVDICKAADRPVLVFPECTTSNNRGLLRFADVFPGAGVPCTAGPDLYLACTRYDPPTPLAPSPTQPVPGDALGPLTHAFTLACGLRPARMAVRRLPLSEGPSTGTFLASDVLGPGGTAPSVAEACATLIAAIGRLKRVAAGWEDKVAFLEFYGAKKK
jgi:hypothetical protein